MTFIVLALAAFWAWESLLGLLPFRVPGPAQPFLVAAIAYGISLLSVTLVTAAAAAAVVGILHVMTRFAGVEVEPSIWWLPRVRFGRKSRPSRVPNLPR